MLIAVSTARQVLASRASRAWQFERETNPRRTKHTRASKVRGPALATLTGHASYLTADLALLAPYPAWRAALKV
jgi:hypothetical protein